MLRRKSVWLGSIVIIQLAIGAALFGCKGDGAVSITDLNPRRGDVQGEDPVRIFGNNFRNDIGYTIYFGAQKASSVVIVNPSTILLSTPAQRTTGVVDVTILADDGNAFRIPQGFSYENIRASAKGTGAEVKKEDKGNLAF